MSITVKPPYGYYTDADGSDLEGGKIYVGVAGLDAEANPVSVYWDSALTVAAAQPIRTIGGAPDNSGTPADFFTAADYSVTVRTSADMLVYSKLQLNANDPDNLGLFKVYDTVALLLASNETARGTGAIWEAGGFRYIEVASGGDVTTAGSIQLDVMPDAQGYNVLAFNADPTGASDCTAAFNLATRSTVAHGGNGDLAMRRDIYIPDGDFVIDGTVYIRKGQRLRGAGDGTTRIRPAATSTGRVTFKLGYGLISAVETVDAGGLPPIIQDMHTFGGDASGPVIDMQVSGAQARHIFMTSCGVGFRVGGGDTIVANTIIDQALSAMVFSGQNHIVDSVLFYQANYGMTFGSTCYDIQVNNCHFEYSEYNDILFQTSATDIKNISISDCQFIKNIQYGTATAAINIQTNNAEIQIRGCDFRNQVTQGINVSSGLSAVVKVSDCTFNGNKTTAAYAQSTTATGIRTANSIFEIANCHFENLFGSPITVTGATSGRVTVKGCTYNNIATATEFVEITSTAGDIEIYDCVGDNVLPLFNVQQSRQVIAYSNRKWLGAQATASSRIFVKIPTFSSQTVRVRITANTNTAGNASYRKTSVYLLNRHVDNTGAAVFDYLRITTLDESPTSFAPLIADQIDLDAVGSGVSLAYVVGRYAVISVPDSYGNVSFEADYL